MKKITTFLFAALLFASCEKDKETDPAENLPADVQFLYDAIWNKTWDNGQGNVITFDDITSFTDTTTPTGELRSFEVATIEKYVSDSSDQTQGYGLLVSGEGHKVKVIYRDNLPDRFVVYCYKNDTLLMSTSYSF